MGTFDYLRVEYPLPDGHKPAAPMQTKSLDCDLTQYTLGTEGELRLGDDLVEFTGLLDFYDFDDATAQSGWHEYAALFERGRLLHFVPVTSDESR
ncbi:MAG TPA: hypothetical protein VL418_03850 [Devosiaceae bacterium]|nr:hypothetical protein [Devosiaceae bacterium]